jgi:hypothetical protein
MRVFIYDDDKQIEALTKTIEEREKVTRRVEREIKNARVGGILACHTSHFKVFCQDRWQPALEQLVASIGKKFSAAFDRQSLNPTERHEFTFIGFYRHWLCR